MADIDDLLSEFRRPDAYPMVVTGAGVSLASGIPTFRGSDPDAVWSKDVLEMGTYAYFVGDPVGSWRWYLSRFDAARDAEPNGAHHALADIEKKLTDRGARFMLVTQNVDGLHLKAGSENVVEIHGSARKMRCSTRFAKCEHGEPDGFLPWDDTAFAGFRANPCVETLPRCPSCGALIRAHVLWFDEGYSDHEDYGLDHLFASVEDFTCVLCVGTSFSVGITDIILSTAFERGVPVFAVDPSPVPFCTSFRAKAEEFLPTFAAAL